MPQLHHASLTALDPRVAVPGYDRSALRSGIAHIGVGGFHRSHQAVYLDSLLNAGLAEGWGITGIGLLPHDAAMRDVLQAQDHLYTVVQKHPDGTLSPTVVGSLVDYLYAPDRPEAVLALLTDPALRIVSLTITEGGYHSDPTTGDLVLDEALRRDLAPGAPPSTAFGYLVEALARRREAGVAPFTVMSCDNIQGNGALARAMITAFARHRDEGLGQWIASEVAFPNSMVDRITPVTTDADRDALAREFGVEDAWPVVCEPFTQWVLEDDFPAGRPPFEAAGVQLVDDVLPYELVKLRLLNAGHQVLGHLGHLSGHRYAHEAAQDPTLAAVVLEYMTREASPTLAPVPGLDLDAYRIGLLKRFANPEVRDSLSRLCTDASDRIPTFLLPVVRERLARGEDVRFAALAVAAWARYAEGTDELGEPITVVDRRAADVMARARRNRDEPLAFLEDEALFGDLRHDPAFTGPFSQALRSLHTHGVRATLKRWLDDAVVDGTSTPAEEH